MKYQISPYFVFLFFLATCFMMSACKSKNQSAAEQMVLKWLGREIAFPSAVRCTLYGKETDEGRCRALHDSEYKVLVYVDSAGCSDCRLKLHQWKDLMEEADRLCHGKLTFLFYLQPKSNDSKEIEFLMRRNRFVYPVFIDSEDQIGNQNELPIDPEYQCFLLDQHNRVVLIGSPVTHPKMWKLYLSTVSGRGESAAQSRTTIEVDKRMHDFGLIPRSQSSEAVFEIKNTGDHAFIIHRVHASCGCTRVDWDKRPIRVGGTTKIKVQYTPGQETSFLKSISVYGNMEKSPVLLNIKGNIEN